MVVIEPRIKNERNKRKQKRLYFRKIYYGNNIPDIDPTYLKHEDLIKLNVGSKHLSKNEKVSCLIDSAFKTLIMNTRKAQYIAKFISNVFNISYEEACKKVSFNKNELDKEYIEDKAYRSDGVVEVEGNYILFEINRTAMEERNISYLDRMLGSKILYRGERILPSGCFLININYYIYKGHDKTIEIYLPRNEEGELLTYCKQIMNIYIPNVVKKYYNGDSLNEIERWALVMSLTNVEVAKEIGKGDEVLMELIDDSVRVKDNSKFIKDYDFEIEERDSYIEMGFEQGIEQGEVNKESEIIQKLYSKGLSIEDISDTLELDIVKIKEIIGY